MFQRKTTSWLKHWDFILLDIVCLELCFVIFSCIRNRWDLFVDSPTYRGLFCVLLFIDLAVCLFAETYKNVLKRGSLVEFTKTVSHTFLVFSITLIYLFMVQLTFEVSRLVLGFTFVVYLLLSYGVRVFWKSHLIKVFSQNALKSNRSLLIVATSDTLKNVEEDILLRNNERYYISGICVLDKDMIGQKIGECTVVCSKEHLLDYSLTHWVDEVLFCLHDYENTSALIHSFMEMGITVHLSLANFEMMYGKNTRFSKFGGTYVMTTSMSMATPQQVFYKRCLDLAGAIVGCLLTVILILVIGPIIYIKSPGPIFYKQVRVGKGGKKFNMYKFRSMVMNADELKKDLMKNNQMDGLMFKMENDPRIIPGIGHFIRKTSLDEFPQFFNVLRGEMSLVGTRPPTVDEWEKYHLHHRSRLAIKPGITGLWQTSGRNTVTDFEDVVKLDTEYIINWTFSMDIKILFKTIQVVFKREGSM